MSELFRIKPLEWGWFETERKRGYRAQSRIFRAMVFQLFSQTSDGTWSWRQWFVHGDALTVQPCTSPEEGKQLAEAHWREYIAQALIPAETNE